MPKRTIESIANPSYETPTTNLLKGYDMTTLERIITQLEARGYTVTENDHMQGYRVTMASGYVLLPRAKAIELAAINLAHSKGYVMGMHSAIVSMRASDS